MIFKKLSLFTLLFAVFSVRGVNVVLHNKIPLNMYARWEFVGDYFRRDIPPATYKTAALQSISSCTQNQWANLWAYGKLYDPVETAGIQSVNDWRLHKGFSDVHTRYCKVGDMWGIDPDTGCALVFTPNMLNSLGECWGIQPSFYSSSGQAVYNNFALFLVPVRNPNDNNNWWPSFRIIRTDADWTLPI